MPILICLGCEIVFVQVLSAICWMCLLIESATIQLSLALLSLFVDARWTLGCAWLAVEPVQAILHTLTVPVLSAGLIRCRCSSDGHGRYMLQGHAATALGKTVLVPTTHITASIHIEPLPVVQRQ